MCIGTFRELLGLADLQWADSNHLVGLACGPTSRQNTDLPILPKKSLSLDLTPSALPSYLPERAYTQLKSRHRHK